MKQSNYWWPDYSYKDQISNGFFGFSFEECSNKLDKILAELANLTSGQTNNQGETNDTPQENNQSESGQTDNGGNSVQTTSGTTNEGDTEQDTSGTTSGTTDNSQISPTTSNYYENIPFDVNDIPNNQIWYQTYSNSMLIPYGISTARLTSQGLFGANLLSNNYNNNFGILTFDGDVTNMATWTFFEQEDLMTLAVPKCQKEVGGLYKSGLKYLLFPTNSNLEIIGDLSFCPLEQITIPKYVTTIHNLYGCTKLSTIISHPLTAPTIVGNESFKYAGRDVSGEKILYVRQNAVGYDDDKWVTQVQNNGYVKTVF